MGLVPGRRRSWSKFRNAIVALAEIDRKINGLKLPQAVEIDFVALNLLHGCDDAGLGAKAP